MLRVGLTGELGSGKSTVLRLLGELGAVTMSSDEIGRAMMEPGEPVYDAILRQFGPSVVLADGRLNRPELARLAFDPEHPRTEELNAIVHPAVIAEQERRLVELARTAPDAVVVIESALIFSTRHGGEEPWRKRFDRIVVVQASEALKVERYVQRVRAAGQPGAQRTDEELRADATRRLRAQAVSPAATDLCYRINNDGDLAALERQVRRLWTYLRSSDTADS